MITKSALCLAAGILSLTALSPAPGQALPIAGASIPTINGVEPILHRCVQTRSGQVICGRVCPNGRISPSDFCGYGPYGYYRPYYQGYYYNYPGFYFYRGW